MTNNYYGLVTNPFQRVCFLVWTVLGSLHCWNQQLRLTHNDWRFKKQMEVQMKLQPAAVLWTDSIKYVFVGETWAGQQRYHFQQPLNSTTSDWLIYNVAKKEHKFTHLGLFWFKNRFNWWAQGPEGSSLQPLQGYQQSFVHTFTYSV